MALSNDKNQGDNLESTKIAKVTGIKDSQDLSNLDTDVSKEQLAKMELLVPSLEPNVSKDPPVKTFIPSVTDKVINSSSFGSFSEEGDKPRPMTTEEATYRKSISTSETVTTTNPKSPAQPVGDFLANMAAISKPDTAISKPINQDIDFSAYKDYLPKNKFYYDNSTQLDKSRALNQSNWEQAAYATGRTLINVVPEAIKQIANAFDVEDWSNSNLEVGNFVADAMTSAQQSVKDAMPIYRENPNTSLDVGDFAYWMETGEGLVTSIGGFVLAGYATAGIASVPGKILNAAAEIRAASIAKKVADGIRGSSKFQNALNVAKANQVGNRIEGLAVNFLLNQAESVGIGADVFKNVYTTTYNNAIVAGKTEEEAKKLGKEAGAKGAAASINFNRLNMLLNTTSSDLFLKSPAAISGLIKKEGYKQILIEGGKEAGEEYINDLGQLYGEGLDTDTPLTFNKAVSRLATAQGIESPILGAIGGIGQHSLTKAGKYIQTSNNESYMRHFNQYLMNNPMTEATKESSIQAATAYAQAQANKDKPMGLFTNKQGAGYTTSTAQQIESLYVAQQSALADYDTASKDDKLLDIVNSSFSAQFSVDLLNQIKSNDTLTPLQKNVLLEQALLSHQAYKSLEIGTLSELKNLYKTYTTMNEDDARTRGILTTEKEGEPDHYKTKAASILKTLDVYENNYNVSKSFINSTEVYDKLNNSYFNDRDVTELTKKYDSKLGELDDIIVEFHKANGNTDALLALEESRLTGKIILPTELKNSKLSEETKDSYEALRIARKKKLDNTLELQRITADSYTKDLTESIKLYRNKQIAEKNKATITKTTAKAIGSSITKAKNILKRKENLEAKKEEVINPTVPQPTTNTSSTTGNVQQSTSNTLLPSNTSLTDFITSDIKGSETMTNYLEADTKSINKLLKSNFSLDSKINKLKEHIENKVKYDSVNLQSITPDAEEVIGKIVVKLQNKVKELEDYKENLSPETKEANETYDANVTDFALDLEEDNIANPALDNETEEPLPFNKQVIDTKYDIYSSILEEMDKRGVDTSNYEEVMTEFRTILGTRLVKTQYNSLQALFNLVNNTNENQSYKDLFDTADDIDTDLNLSNKLAKVTLPNGKFVYDIDEESRIAMQNTKQSIIVNNPNAEVKGIAYPIYNEVGSNLLAYLAQSFEKVFTKKTTPDGKEYYEIDKTTVNSAINSKLNSEVLEDNFFKVGDTISFLPLDSYIDDNGEIIMADALPVDEKPIGVVHNGTLIDGVYLHTVSWITAENLNNTPAGIKNDRATLSNLRNKIIKGEDVNTTITEISPGAPITNPNNELATFASQFEEFPVGIVRNGVLETSSYSIDIPEYLHFNEGSVVTKVNDYFYYGSRTRLFRPMRAALVSSLKAFALGEHNEGTKALLGKNTLDVLTGKGLQFYMSKLIHTSSIKLNNSFPTDLETFKDALNTRPETEVVVNFIKGSFYIGRGQGLDVMVINPSSFKGNEESLNEILSKVNELLEDSFANVSLEGLKTNQPLLIINEQGLVKTFPSYDNYIKHVSTSEYGSVVLPSGNKITTIQKRINFDLPLIENKTEKLISTTTKRGRPKKIQETIKAIEESTDLFSDVTEEDLSPDNLQNFYDFSATSNSGKWNSANNELASLVQGNKKAFAIYKFLIGDLNSFKEIIDYLNERGIEIPYTNSMKRADETMTIEEKNSAINSYNNSVTSSIDDKSQIEKDVLSENNLQDEIEYSPQTLIEKYPLTGVQKVIWDLIKDIVNKLEIKVKFSSSRITEGFDGSNNPVNGEILIRPSTLKNGRFAEVLVHEVVHALTTKIISRVNSGVTTGLTQKQINAVKGLMKLYEAVKADNNLENKYPVKDVFEFIAHLTNEAFVKELESKDKNFLQKIVDFISDILGLNNANELSKKYLIDIISNGVFLQENGITVLPSDYGNNLQGSKNTVDLAPIVEEKLKSPSLIEGLSNAMQEVIIDDIVQDYYGLHLQAKGTNTPIIKLEEFFDAKTDLFDVVVLKAKAQNYKGYDKLVTQLAIIKANKAKLLEIVRQNLTKQLGIVITDKNLIIENTNDDQNLNEDNVDAPEGIEIDDATERERIYDINEFSIDPKLDMSNAIKYLLHNIIDAQLKFEDINTPVLNKDGQLINQVSRRPIIIPRKTAFQVPVRVNPNIVYQDLLKVFSKSSSNDGMDTTKFNPDANSTLHPKIQVAIKVLESLKTTQPYYANVIDKIKEMDSQTQLQFIKTFNKNNTDHIKIIEYSNKDGESLSLRIIKNSTQNATNELIRKWDINLKSIGGYNPMNNTITFSPIVYNAFNRLYNILAGNTDLHDYNNFKALFHFLGIELSLPAFEKLRDSTYVNGKLKTINQQFEHSDGWLKRIKNRLDFMMETDTNGKPLYKDIDVLYKDKVFKELATFLMNFDKSTFNTSFKNGNGDTIHGVTNNRYFMERMNGLKNNTKLLKNLSDNAFSSNSTWLSKLYNKSTSSINRSDFLLDFTYETFDSYAVNANNKSKLVSKMNRKELIKMNLSLFYNSGLTRLQNTIPVHRFIIPALSDKANVFEVQAQGRVYNYVDGKLSDNDLTFLRTQFFDGEFNRIVNTQLKDPLNVKGYNEGGSKFLLFPKFNDIPTLWNNGIINVEALNADNPNNTIEDINEVIMNYVNDGYHTNYNKWKELRLLKEGKEGIYDDKMEYVDNFYTENLKKNPKVTMTPASSIALNYTINYLVANANMQYLLFNDPAFYYKKGKMNQNKTLQITSDIEETWDNATKRYAAVNGGKDNFEFPSGSTFSVLSIEDTSLKSNNLDYLSTLWAGHPDHDLVISKNSAIENGDAQEYTSLEEHLDRMVYSSALDESIAFDILKEYKETGKLSKKNLDTVLIPFKPLYFNTYMGDKGVMETLYIKTSSLPLLKEFTKTLQLDTLREYLENPKNKVKVAVFASGIKSGNPIKSLKLFDENGNVYADALQGDIEAHIIRNIPREGHGNQQNNPDKSKKTEINDGTQQAKLLFTNILDVVGFKNPFDKKEVSGRQLANLYLSRYEKRFQIQYNKLIKELNVVDGRIGNTIKLKTILTKEAITKGWTFNEAASFELDESGLNFDIPLWLSISSSKIENLLSSIVDNRIRKRKRFGRSYILASDAGIRTFDATQDTKQKGITFLDTFKGELKNSYNDNGEMISADILVPFRFFDNNGKLLNIKDYLNQDGTLNTQKLPTDLLQGFGFRIPTSGINLMSNIRIVGFLPESYGDVVIAPADFTIQMGSDFDVDKFYSNTYATYYNEATGILEKLGTKHIEERQVIADKVFKLTNDAKRLKNYKGKAKDELILENKTNKKLQENNPLYKIKNLDVLILDNEILDIQRAILDNPATEVQRARTKPLSFGRLQEMIEKFGKKGNKEYFTFLDRNVQDENYISANLGKTAVSNFSLDMILNSLGQYSDAPLYFQYKIKTAKGYTFKRVNIKAFGFKNNDINNPLLNDRSGRYKSDVLEGLMAASLDNGKEKILGKLYVTDSTFSFIRAMIASGYNEEVIMGIINQPIVKMYLDPVTGSTAKSILQNAAYRLKGTNTRLGDYTLDTLQEELTDYSNSNAEEDVIKLYEKAVIDGELQNSNLELQISALGLFLTMDKNGQALAQVRSALSVDSTGVGKNIVYSNGKIEQAEAAMANATIANVSHYFRAVTYNPETERTEKVYSSIGNSALKYGVATNVNLWNKYFPFDSEIIQDLIRDIGQRTGKDIFRLSSYSDYATLVLKDFKSFLSAKQLDNAVPAFMKNKEARDIYKSIIYSSTDHQSLGEFIETLRTEDGDNIKYTNDLLNSLTIDAVNKNLLTNITPGIVNISYSTDKRIDNSENKTVNSLIEMINEPIYLGLWNNNSITTKDLANLLILHQMYSKGIPSSTKFIQYIPTTYLKRLGYYNQMSSVFSNYVNPDLTNNLLNAQFLMQHLQHNMKDYYNYKLDKAYSGYFTDGVFTGTNQNLMPKYIVFMENGNYHVQYLTTKGFIRLNPLGWGDNTEYNHDVLNPTSLNFKNNISNVGVKEIKVKDVLNAQEEIENNNLVLPFTVQLNSTIGKKTTIQINDGVDVIVYPIQLTENGTNSEFYLTKNGNSYNNLYHPITSISVPIDGLDISNNKEERDSKLIAALSVVPLDILTELGLTTEAETVNIKAIENNIEEFMTSTRDKSEDVFPNEINTVEKNFAEELGLVDKSLNLQDKYNLIFNVIQKTNGKSNPILKYFLANAIPILPVISSTPIILDPNLKAKGMYKSNNEYGYIAINPTKFSSVEEMASIVAEEAIHALFKKQIKVKNAITKDLEKVRKEVEDLLIAEYGEKALVDMKAKLENKEPLIKGVESDLLYSVHNLDEFIAAVLTKPTFQEYLNNNEIKLAKKTLWEKVLELLAGLLESLGVKQNTKLANALGGIFALTEDIKNNHLANLPKVKYERSIGFINEKFNLVTDTNELSLKGNALEIATFINENFAGVNATVIEKDYVEVLPISFNNYSLNIDTNQAPDDWSLESLEFAGINNTGVESVNKEIRANYYQYASSLRARIIQGEKKLRRLKAEKKTIEAEQLNSILLKDKVDLMSVPKLKNLTDFALKAKEDLHTVNTIMDTAMNSEDIVYVRNILNFWKDARDYTFTDKHKESNELMRVYGTIENEAKGAITRLKVIEKDYLNKFVSDTLGRDVDLDDVFKNYKDIWSIQANVRDISTYDNELLSAIWKEINFANMKAEAEAQTVLSRLNATIDKILPKLKSINSISPYEIFRQSSENGLKTNHLINTYSTKFYKDKGRAYNGAKESQTAAAANSYANWVKVNTRVIDLNKYFESDTISAEEVDKNRDALKNEVGEYAYSLWFNGQNRKINSYNKRKEAVEAIIKTEFKMDLDTDINENSAALLKLQNWSKKHSPFEFSKVINSATYKYYDGSEGIDGFQTYEVLPNKEEHFNKEFEIIAKDEDLMEFYHEFSEIYENLKAYVPASQLSTLMYGGLPVIEKSIYQMFSTGGLKVGFKGLSKAWTNSITSSYKDNTKKEYDLVTEQNAKDMSIPGVTSNAPFINNYINSKSIEYEVNTGKLPTPTLVASFREEAVNAVAEQGDFDLGKLMKIFSTLVISHKHIAAIEDLVKISQYTLNSYQESEFNVDGSKAFISGGTQSVLPTNQSFVNTKKAFTYTINNLLYGEIKQEEGRTTKKKLTPEEKDVKASYLNSLLELQDKFDNGEVTEDAYNNLKDVIETNIEKLGSVIVASKIGDNWLKTVQLKLMGWNILGGFSNSAFGFIGNMIEASGEGSFNLDEMRNAYKMVSASVGKNLTFNKVSFGESEKIRSAMNKMNVMKEASHELYTANETLDFGDKFKFASPYNMNQRTEYLNQAPIMIIYAKKTMVDTKKGKISIWEGMNENWEWDVNKYGELPIKTVLEMRLNITKQIQRIHGNYDPTSPLMIKEKFVGRALSQFRTWLYESVAVRFEKERQEDAIGQVVKGRYRTLLGIIFENEDRMKGLDVAKEFGKAMVNAFTFGKIKVDSFQNTNLSDIDAQNMKKVAMELVLLIDVYILIAVLKAGLSDDDDESKALYNVLLNQGTRLKSDLLLYVNPNETRNILKDVIPSVTLWDDAYGLFNAITNLDNDEIKSGVHKGDSRIGNATMKFIPGPSRVYSTYNSMSQIYDKSIDLNEEDN